MNSITQAGWRHPPRRSNGISVLQEAYTNSLNDQDPEIDCLRGLAAAEVVQGELFADTVVLLLYYDETGAFGLVVNRPTDVKPEELLADEDALAGYGGTLFWGGPVQMDSLRALVLTEEPPEGAEKIIESVYLVSYEDALDGVPRDPSSLRFFIGYAGWAPGQLDNELAHGSWRIVPGSSELVFANEPETLWKRLVAIF
jgi:putative transcriptional regulator